MRTLIYIFGLMLMLPVIIVVAVVGFIYFICYELIDFFNIPERNPHTI